MIAALLLVASIAQGQPADTAQTPTAPPTYSLVVGRQTSFARGGHMGCMRIGNDLICPRHDTLWFDHARSLAGPPVDPDMQSYTTAGRGFGYVPFLFVMIRDGDDPRIVAMAAVGRDSRACLSRAVLDELGFHPSGPEIIQAADGGVCADLSPLVAIWAPDDVYSVAVMTDHGLIPFRVDRRASLIVARIVGRHPAEPPQCGSGIPCLPYTVRAELADVTTLTGRRLPSPTTVLLTLPTAPPDGERVLIGGRHMEDGSWIGQWTWPVAPSGQETCYPSQQTGGLFLGRPRRARLREQRTCISL